MEDQYEWIWVYVAVEPTTGTCIVWFLPTSDGENLAVFLPQFRQETGTSAIGIGLDNAPSHHSQHVVWPDRLTPVYLLPYSPELDPAEQLFRQLRQLLANRVFDNLEQLREAITQELHQWWDHPSILVQLTDYPWWQAAFEAKAS